MEVKKIIENYLHIPISKQILIFNNHLLNDTDIIFMTNFTPASTIHLRVAPDTPIKNPEPQEPLTPEPEEAPAPATATAPKEAPAKEPPNSKSRSLSVMMVPRANRGEGNFTVSDIEPFEKASDLKKFLESYKKSVLPQDCNYFFIHNHEVMFEDRSFAWHGVKDGDIIEIFDGVVDNNCLGHRCV
ncbi:hypothetical protein RYX36_021081 [Vicia faba]